MFWARGYEQHVRNDNENNSRILQDQCVKSGLALDHKVQAWDIPSSCFEHNPPHMTGFWSYFERFNVFDVQAISAFIILVSFMQAKFPSDL